MRQVESEAAEPDLEDVGRSRWPSPIWLVPLVVVVGALGLMFQSFATRGPEISVIFATASGLKAGETPVRFRDVEVGRVQSVTFTEDLKQVRAVLRMDQSVAPYLDESAKFWVVRPQVSAQGITGIETVISGSYIEASWDAEPGEQLEVFTALEELPQTPEGTPGIRLTLRAEDGGSLEIGSPILFKRVEVGRVESKRLSDDGSAVEFEIFVNAPNDQLITDQTRFWNASGVDLQLGADGAQLRIASLSSLLRGGASFDQVGSGTGTQAEPGTVFRLFPSESDARENVAIGDITDRMPLLVFFDGSVRGLQAGASVEYQGIRIGRVDAVTAAVDPEDGTFRTRTQISLSPSLLGLPEGDRDAVRRFLGAAIESGLRAKLAMGNLLTGSLYVNLEDARDPPTVEFDQTADVPVLPSLPSDIDQLTGSVEGVLDRVDALPIEALIANAVSVLDNLNQLTAADEAQALPGEALALLNSIEALVAAPEVARTIDDASAAVQAFRSLAEDPALAETPAALSALVASLSGLAAELERAGTAADLAATMDAVRALAEDPQTAALPDSASALLSAATALLEDPALTRVPAEINTTLADLQTLLSGPELQGLPADLSAALASLRLRLDDPGLVQATAELGPLLADARAAITDLSRSAEPALASLEAILADPALERTPEALTGTLEAARKVLETTDLTAISAEAVATLAALRRVLDTPGAQAAPDELTATLTEARRLLTSLEEAGAAENLAATLASARRLVDNPALIRASDELAGTLAALRVVLAAPGADQLPASAVGALTEAEKLLAQFRAQGLAESSAGALDRVAEAGRAVERSVADLPALLARLTEVTQRADVVLGSVGEGSELNFEAIAMIRDIRDAARAVTDLADLVQRNPNSIILGK